MSEGLGALKSLLDLESRAPFRSLAAALRGNSQPNAQPRGEMRQMGIHRVSACRGGKDDPEPGRQGNALGWVSIEMLWRGAELGVAWQQHWLVLAASEEK